MSEMVERCARALIDPDRFNIGGHDYISYDTALRAIVRAIEEEREAVVKWLRREGPADKDMHTWRYCQDMLAITIERGEHHE